MDRNMTPDQRNAILAQIKPGMDVVDADGDKVGSVDFVQMADENALLGEPEPRENDEGIIEGIAEAVTGEGEHEVTERMMTFGYVKIDAAGIFTGSKYVQPEQIAAIDGNTVSLSILKDNIGHPS
jgi:hypothetical protein